MARLRIGEVLVGMGALSQEQLQHALSRQPHLGYKLGDVLVALELCSPALVLQGLARQTGLRLLALDDERFDREAARLLPLKVARARQAVALRFTDAQQRELVVAIAAPASLDALDAVRSATGKRIVPFLASEASVLRAMAAIYSQATPGPRPLTRAIELAPSREEHLELELEPVASLPHLRGYHEGASTKAVKPLGIVQRAPEVLLYGWSAQVAERLVQRLGERDLVAAAVSPGQTLAAGAADVVVSPLPAVEQLLPMGRRLRARLIVAGHEPTHDFERAQRVGASGFMLAPVDTDLLVRSIQKTQRQVQIAA